MIPKKCGTQNVVYVGKSNSLEDKRKNLEITLSETEAETMNGSSRTMKCNFARNRVCLLKSNCRYENGTYRCKATSENREYFYIGTSSCYIKQRIATHLNSLRHRNEMNTTSLSIQIWALKDGNKVYLFA